jgi:hypothetical protein
VDSQASEFIDRDGYRHDVTPAGQSLLIGTAEAESDSDSYRSGTREIEDDFQLVSSMHSTPLRLRTYDQWVSLRMRSRRVMDEATQGVLSVASIETSRHRKQNGESQLDACF